MQVAKLVTLSREQQNIVDERFVRLAGKGGIGKSSKSVFRKTSSMKAADWLHFVQYFDVYVFQNASQGPAVRLLGIDINLSITVEHGVHHGRR